MIQGICTGIYCVNGLDSHEPRLILASWQLSALKEVTQAFSASVYVFVKLVGIL